MKHKGFLHGLLAVSLSALLAGCGWFGADDALPHVKARPGADRLVAPSASLPPAERGHRFEQGVAPADETRGTPPGSVVAAKGGQRAQREAAEKEIADRDAKEREARAREQTPLPPGTPTEAAPSAAPATPQTDAPKS